MKHFIAFSKSLIANYFAAQYVSMSLSLCLCVCIGLLEIDGLSPVGQTSFHLRVGPSLAAHFSSIALYFISFLCPYCYFIIIILFFFIFSINSSSLCYLPYRVACIQLFECLLITKQLLCFNRTFRSVNRQPFDKRSCDVNSFATCFVASRAAQTKLLPVNNYFLFIVVVLCVCV